MTKFDVLAVKPTFGRGRKYLTPLGKTAQQILDAFGIDKVTLKNHLLKLMQMDEKFYKIGGMETRAVSGNAKFSKNGLRLSPSLLSNYGFNQSDEFKVSCLEEGKIVLEKK